MGKLTRRQRAALQTLHDRHERYTRHDGFFASMLGPATASLLRKIEPTGFVDINRMADNCYRYSITDAGRRALSEGDRHG